MTCIAPNKSGKSKNEPDQIRGRGQATGRHSLAEAGQVLHHLGDEREGAGRALGGVLLHQAEQGWGHDGRAHEAEEQGGADEAVSQIFASTLGTSGSPRGKNFLQLPRKYAEMRTIRNNKR